MPKLNDTDFLQALRSHIAEVTKAAVVDIAPRKGLRLEGDGVDPVDDPSTHQIRSRLARLRVKGPSFFSLTAPDGTYVQLAGSRRRLTLEWHRVRGKGVSHYVLGTRDAPGSTSTIKATCGPITVYANETHMLADAKMVFERMLAGTPVREGFSLRDISAEVA